MTGQDTQSGSVPPLQPVQGSVLTQPYAKKQVPSIDRAEFLGLPPRRRDTAALLVLALMADICLYRTWGGTGGATLLIVTMIGLMLLRGWQPAARQYMAIVPILALAAILVWTAWWLVAVMSFVWIFVLAVQLWRPDWSLMERISATADSIAFSPPRLLGHIMARCEQSRKPGRQRLPAKIIVIPVIISIAFIIIFAAANPVISRECEKLGDRILDLISRLDDYLTAVRFLFWLGALLVFAALIRPVIRTALNDRIKDLDTCLEPTQVTPRIDINFRAASVTLVCVNAIFLAYNCMDAVYLYFKATLPDGISWTAYTHAGCGWLTFGLFLSTVVLGFIFWNELNFHSRTPLLKKLAYLWIVLNVVLAVGTLRRVQMYIDFSGLTHLLLTGIYGALLVMVGIVIMALKVIRNHNAVWLLRRYVAAFIIGLTALALTPRDWVCATYNVPRVLAEKPHAIWPICLKELTAEALPPIIPLMDYRRKDRDETKEKLVREGIAAILGIHLARLEEEGRTNSWTQGQISSRWALKHLLAAKDKICETAPPADWHKAKQRLKSDFNLSGEPQ